MAILGIKRTYTALTARKAVKSIPKKPSNPINTKNVKNSLSAKKLTTSPVNLSVKNIVPGSSFYPPVLGALLLEDGGYLLTEDGGRIYIE